MFEICPCWFVWFLLLLCCFVLFIRFFVVGALPIELLAVLAPLGWKAAFIPCLAFRGCSVAAIGSLLTMVYIGFQLVSTGYLPDDEVASLVSRQTDWNVRNEKAFYVECHYSPALREICC